MSSIKSSVAKLDSSRFFILFFIRLKEERFLLLLAAHRLSSCSLSVLFVAEVDWKKGKKEGKGIMYYNNGDRYEGEFKNGVREGEGILFYKNGQKDKGVWKNDIFQKNELFDWD